VYRKLIRLILIAIVGSVIAASYGYYKVTSWSQERAFADAASNEDGTIIEFPSGTGLSKLAKTLYENRLIDSTKMFELFVRINGDYNKFQAGKYRFLESVSPLEIVTKIRKGDIYWPVIVEYTIPEGFTLRKIADRLAANGIGHIKQLDTLLMDPTFAKSLKVPADTFEGFIYPATYQYIKMPSPQEAISHMVDTFWKKLPKNYEANAKKRGLSLKDAITFASLIELETKRDEERSIISEVIWSRLKDRAPLAIDAALIYGIKDYRGDIKWIHLRDAKNPYNTRIHKGLPPTPIGSPSVESLKAVLTPTNTGAYFYVLLPNSDKHHFSKTHKEHQQYVRKLVEAHRRNKSNNK